MSQAKKRHVSCLIRALRLGLFAIVTFVIGLHAVGIYLYTENFVLPTAQRPVEAVEAPWMDAARDASIVGDGVLLAGWYVPPQNDAVIILLHGYGGDRRAMAWHADQLYAAGYGLLLVDLRGHGESGGERRSYGWEDAADVPGMAAYVQAQGGEHIGLAGHSTGGQVALRGARLAPSVDAILADGASVAQARDLLPLRNLEDALFFPANSLLDRYQAYRLDRPVPAPVREDIASLGDRPVLLIGGGDLVIERDRMTSYAAAGGDNVALWLVEGAVHGTTWRVAPQAYAERMLAFFDAALK